MGTCVHLCVSACVWGGGDMFLKMLVYYKLANSFVSFTLKQTSGSVELKKQQFLNSSESTIK